MNFRQREIHDYLVDAIMQIPRKLVEKRVDEYLEWAIDFKPNSAQLPFIASGATVRAFAGANSVGKTEVSCEELHAHLTGMRAFMLDPEGIIESIKEKEGFEIGRESYNWDALSATPFRFKSARVLCRDLQHTGKTVIVPKIMKWLYPWIKAAKKNQLGIETYFELEFMDHTAVLDVVSDAIPDVRALEGWQGEVIEVDEPVSREAWIATFRGLRSENGRAWFAFTPLSEPWMFYEIKNKADGQRIFWYEADIKTNLGNLRKGYLQEFESMLTADEKEARLHGKFAFLAGLVFKNFSRERYVLPYDIYPPTDWLRLRAIDVHHMRRPQAVLYVAISPDNKAYIYHEIWQHHTAATLAKEILEFEKMEMQKGVQAFPFSQAGFPIIYYSSKIDSYSFTVDNITNTSFADELVTRGVYADPGSKDKYAGIDAIKRWLEEDRIRINPSCARMIFEFETLSHVEPRSNMTDKRIDQIVDRDDDQTENLRRLLIDDPEWIDFKAWKPGMAYSEFCNKRLEF